MGILNGVFHGDFVWGKFGRGRVLWAVFQTLCVFIYIHYRHYKCELALLMSITQSGSASLPVVSNGVFVWGISKVLLNGDNEQVFCMGILNDNFKW